LRVLASIVSAARVQAGASYELVIRKARVLDPRQNPTPFEA